MVAGQSNAGINRLVRAQMSITKRHAPPQTVSFTTGTLDASLALHLDPQTSGPVFPKGAYYLLDYINSLTAEPDPFVTSDTTVVTVDTGGSPSHGHGTEPHVHTIKRPKILAPLIENDRVFVAMMGKGTIPIIIGRIVNSV